MTEKVLLLGNGITREYYQGGNWDEVLDQIKIEELYPLPSQNYKIPMTLKAAMLTKNQLNSRIKDNPKLFSLPPKTEHSFLQDLLKLKFDYILTTNYTYEIECALLETTEVSPSQIRNFHKASKTQNLTIDFLNYPDLMNSYNEINGIKIWHIHGEAAYPESIVFGHKAYGYLLYSYVKKVNPTLNDIDDVDENWIEPFVSGDVYILGFGMNTAETDLWWLLQHKSAIQKKKKIVKRKLKTIFFNPQPYGITCASCNKQYIHGGEEWCKLEMLKNHGVEIRHIPFDNTNNSYDQFYRNALKSIKDEFERNEK